MNKDGTVCIMVRLTVSGEVSQFSSKLNIDPKAWDVSQGKASGNSVKARQLNDLLEDIRTFLKNRYLTDTELQKIMKKKFTTKRLEEVRDVFLFSCFTFFALKNKCQVVSILNTAKAAIGNDLETT